MSYNTMIYNYPETIKKYPDTKVFYYDCNMILGVVTIEYSRNNIHSKWTETKRKDNYIKALFYIKSIENAIKDSDGLGFINTIETTKTKYGDIPNKNIFIYPDKLTKIETFFIFY